MHSCLVARRTELPKWVDQPATPTAAYVASSAAQSLAWSDAAQPGGLAAGAGGELHAILTIPSVIWDATSNPPQPRSDRGPKGQLGPALQAPGQVLQEYCVPGERQYVPKEGSVNPPLWAHSQSAKPGP